MDVTALAMQISVVAFMLGSLAGVGLGVAPRDVLAPLTHGRFVLLTLVIGWLAGPAVASCCCGRYRSTSPMRPRSCCWPWRRAHRLHRR